MTGVVCSGPVHQEEHRVGGGHPEHGLRFAVWPAIKLDGVPDGNPPFFSCFVIRQDFNSGGGGVLVDLSVRVKPGQVERGVVVGEVDFVLELAGFDAVEKRLDADRRQIVTADILLPQVIPELLHQVRVQVGLVLRQQRAVARQRGLWQLNIFERRKKSGVDENSRVNVELGAPVYGDAEQVRCWSQEPGTNEH